MRTSKVSFYGGAVVAVMVLSVVFYD